MPDSTRSTPPPPLKVGALARQTGLTVRALHHYEAVGLLTPAGRTESGHRYYGSPEIRRLHQITSLRQLGFSLQEIAGMLDDPSHTLEETLSRHLEGLRARIREEEELCRRLEALRDRIRRDPDSVPLAELTESVNRTVRVEGYFSDEQLSLLEERRQAVGAPGLARGQAEWGVLLDEFRASMDEGIPPDDARVAELARRAAALVQAFTGGDAGLAESLARLYREEGPERVLGSRGVSLAPGLWEYMTRARAAHGFGPP